MLNWAIFVNLIVFFPFLQLSDIYRMSMYDIIFCVIFTWQKYCLLSKLHCHLKF